MKLNVRNTANYYHDKFKIKRYRLLYQLCIYNLKNQERRFTFFKEIKAS